MLERDPAMYEESPLATGDGIDVFDLHDSGLVGSVTCVFYIRAVPSLPFPPARLPLSLSLNSRTCNHHQSLCSKVEVLTTLAILV